MRGWIVFIASFIALLYINLWWGLISPILTVADAIDNHTVTARLVGWELVKFLVREVVGIIVFYAGFSWATLLWATQKNY